MMSPGNNSQASDNLTICSATDHSIMFKFALCLVTPLTLSQIEPLVKCPVSLTRCTGPMGAERSKLLPISQGFFSSPMARCKSRRVMSRPIA